MEASFSEILVK